MSRGHGIIINMSSWAPFIFTFNPTEIESKKKINYAVAPNIGGAYKKRYFSGFDAKEITFTLQCVDMEGPTGVSEEVAFFEQLREPDPGTFGIANSFFGNSNFPPPKVLFQFGTSYVPLVWDVLDVQITESHFHSGHVRGILGIPKQAVISIQLSLDEGHTLNKANQIAKKAQMFAGSAKSIIREVLHKTQNTRKEMPGLFSSQEGNNNTGTLSRSKINRNF
ncbi:MAG: hypothetical protein ACFFG0_02530 [Candidatus Thorarchaeota archaeon]